jgi:D-glycero-D-manno-heptose 1,7-bisphosphate phosphatase
MRPGVFLDRDGVLIGGKLRDGKPHAAASVAECRLLPGVRPALDRLKAAGLPLAVVTNQPDVRTGEIPRAAVEEIHAHLRHELPLDAIMTCFHVDADNCMCRKPKPGMLRDAAAALRLDVKHSFMVGDRWRDVSAGAAVGCTTILIGGGYGEHFPVAPDHRVADMKTAANVILAALAKVRERII